MQQTDLSWNRWGIYYHDFITKAEERSRRSAKEGEEAWLLFCHDGKRFRAEKASPSFYPRLPFLWSKESFVNHQDVCVLTAENFKPHFLSFAFLEFPNDGKTNAPDFWSTSLKWQLRQSSFRKSPNPVEMTRQ